MNNSIKVFGGVEEETGECFVWPVERRDAGILLPLIQCYILPGTTIVSDCWRAYGGIENLPEGYQHLTVNHSINFVDPETGAHTQNVESPWQKFKQRHRHEYGTARSLFESCVSDYCWRQRFSQTATYYNIE